MAEQTDFERRCTVHLNADKHETFMTERSGLFSIYCGCGWKSQDKPIQVALADEAAHINAAATPATPAETAALRRDRAR